MGDAAAGGTSGTLYAVKAGAKGDITPKSGESTSDGVVWSIPRSVPAAATPLVFDGNIYLFERQGGLASSYDAATGKEHYVKERITGAGAIWASPWAYDGKVFVMDESGTTFVLKAGTSLEVLEQNSLDQDLYWSSPAVANGRVIIRGLDHLYSIK
jgi:outer membrane protein assembly factor BamB